MKRDYKKLKLEVSAILDSHSDKFVIDMKKQKQCITFEKVFSLYPDSKIIEIHSYFDGKLWTSILPSGKNLADPNLYYKLQPGAESSHEIETDIRQQLIIECFKAGAVQVCLKIRDKHKELCYPDFSKNELLNPNN